MNRGTRLATYYAGCAECGNVVSDRRRKYFFPDGLTAAGPRKGGVEVSDHFVLEEAALMDHVARVAAWVDGHPDRLVLLGAQATEPEVEYGWIEPGRPLDAEVPVRIWEIRRFWEKPSEDMARSCLEAGCL